MWAEYGFIRPHIGYAVNNKYVEYISTDCILLQNDINIPLNKKYRDDVKKKYFKWLGDINVNYGFELFVNLFQGVMFTVFCYKFLTPSRNKICEGIAFCVASLLMFLSITQINRLYVSFAYIETVVFFAIMIPYCVLFFKDRIFVKILTPVILNVIYSVLSLYAPGLL